MNGGAFAIASSLSDVPLMPAWIALPIAMLAIIVVAAHVAAMYRDTLMPASRRRIRVANAWLMVIAIPLLASAVSIVSPARPRAFVLVWLAAVGLVMIILVVALIDLLNNHRLFAASRRDLRAEFERARAQVEREMRSASRADAGPHAPSPTPPTGVPRDE